MPKTQGPGWPEAAKFALSIVVNVEEGSEMSVARGDRGPESVDELGVTLKKPVRNFGNESNYLYGIKAGAPRVFGLLDSYGFPCTVTAAAQSLESFPDLAKRIAGAGHEVAAHGWRWVHQFQMEEADRGHHRHPSRRLAVPLPSHRAHETAAGGGGLSLSHGRLLR